MEKKRRPHRTSPKAPKIKDLDVEQRKLAIIKQKQCDAIALHIVRKLIDSPVEEDVFIQSLKYLNQCHYQDIVEERAITKLCGYPICGNIIKDMPPKKFHISTKRNKVYDITERKNYCSNFCYKAGMYIKDQMLSSPLWFRDKEDIPEFHLLPKTEPGVPGQEIDQGILKLDVDEEQRFTSISDFTQDMVNKIPEDIQINAEQKEDLKKDEDKDVSGTQNQYFSNFFTPSLADILQENATYFKNESTSISKTVTIKSELNYKAVINEKENNNVTNKIETKLDSNKLIKPKASLSCTIGFDRTVINTKPNDEEKTKGILKKSKIKTQKKRVSFSSENSVLELEPLSAIDSTSAEPKTEENKNTRFKNTNVIGNVQERTIVNDSASAENKSFKKPEIPETLETAPKTEENKNTNVIGNIQERSIVNDSVSAENKSLKKPEIPETPGTESKPEENKNKSPRFKNTNVIGIVQERSIIFVNKSNNFDEIIKNNDSITKQELKNSDSNLKTETNNKETRLSRLKNSSTFKKVHRISKTMSDNPHSSNTSSNCLSIGLTLRLETSLNEWLTFETALFLYGEENVKKIISEKSFKQYLNKKKNMELDEDKQKQYEEICKRLRLMELADQKFDAKVTGRKRRPLPRYEDLREASEHQDLRVQAFYSGCYEVDLEDDDTDSESVKDDGEDKSNVVQGPPAVLPLVDNKDLLATRRKLFLMCISRAIPIVCEILEESPNSLLAEIKHLINTFDFSASNIVFKSVEWKLVTVILIQILSVRDEELRTELAKKEICLFLSSLTKEFGLPDKYFENVLSKVKVKSLLDECMRKDCEE